MAVKEITIATKGAKPPESWFVTEETIITAALKVIAKRKTDFFVFGFSEFAAIAFEIMKRRIKSARKKTKFCA